MKKSLSLILVVLLVATTLFGCSQPAPAAKAETLKGTGKGYGGDVTVTVTKEGDKITKVEAVGAKETEGIGSKAIKELPAKIVAANGTKVDVIAGATVSSKALIYAVNNALDAKTYPFPPKEEAPAIVAKPVAKGTAGEIVKIGLGQNISIAKSTDATAEKTATAQADVTIAAVGFDKDGKVASVYLDVAQTKVAFDKDMKVTGDKNAEVKSKKDLGKDYGMSKASTLKLDWFEQAANFENWMTGKTVAEIKALKVKERDASHKNVPDVPELTSSVTITVESYIAAVEEAYKNAKDVTGAAKIGLGLHTYIKSSKDKAADVLPVAQMDTTMAVTAFDKDNKIVGTIIDVVQAKVAYDATGKVTTDKAAEVKTKLELGEAYGMAKASSIKKDWFQQIDAFGKWMVGKTVDQVTGLKVKERDAAHKSVPDVPELTSSVTITVDPYQAAIKESLAMAK